MRMTATIRFNKEIDLAKHYIAPGGYEMTFSNDRTAKFDFVNYAGSVRNDDKTLLDCEMLELDADACKDAEFLKTFTGSVTEIVEFYVYTEEDKDSDSVIYPVSLEALCLTNDYDEEIAVDGSLLGEIFESLEDCFGKKPEPVKSKKVVAVINSEYVRDMQVMFGSENDENDTSYDNEDEWRDFYGDIFLGIYEVTDKENAEKLIKNIAEKYDCANSEIIRLYPIE